MPIHSGKDNQGSFYQWGKTGKKYYYVSSNEESRKRAYKKAQAQQTAIYSSGYKGDSEMKKPTMKLVNVIVKRKDSKPAKKVTKKISKRITKKDWDDPSPEDIARANKFWEQAAKKYCEMGERFVKSLKRAKDEIEAAGKDFNKIIDMIEIDGGDFETVYEDAKARKMLNTMSGMIVEVEKALKHLPI